MQYVRGACSWVDCCCGLIKKKKKIGSSSPISLCWHKRMCRDGHYPLANRISQRNVTSKTCVDVFFPSIITTKLQTLFFFLFLTILMMSDGHNWHLQIYRSQLTTLTIIKFVVNKFVFVTLLFFKMRLT